MGNKIKTMQADDLHNVGQNATQQSKFVTPGVPASSLANMEDTTNPELSKKGTEGLRNALNNNKQDR